MEVEPEGAEGGVVEGDVLVLLAAVVLICKVAASAGIDGTGVAPINASVVDRNEAAVGVRRDGLPDVLAGLLKPVQPIGNRNRGKLANLFN